MNPFKILGTKSHSHARSNFIYYMLKGDKEKRWKYCLAFDMICNSSRYNVKKRIYKPIIKDEFYYVNIGDLKNLKSLLQVKKDKKILDSVDELKRSLLYLAARNGNDEMVEYLIQIGANINKTQKNGSTPLHGAAFYGHESVVKILIENGCNPYIKNNFGHQAIDEARTESIAEIIKDSFNNKILKLYHSLSLKGKVTNLVTVKKDEKPICIKLICKNDLDHFNKEDYTPVWHGTKFKYLESIVINGLKPSGSKLPNGIEIKPPSGHIKLDKTVEGIENWAKAVFFSPSCIYSSLGVYAEKIYSNQQEFACLIEGRAKKGEFTKHRATSQRKKVPGEPKLIEYRIEVDDENEEYRPFFIKSVVFISKDFLNSIQTYEDSFEVLSTIAEHMVTSENLG